ncbi:MAG: hypothetical protein R3C28_16295 [Pirellulaceae bacterium]
MLNIKQRLLLLTFLSAGIVTLPSLGRAQSFIEEPPIAYSETADNNRVSKLIKTINSGETTLDYDRETGYLKSFLAALEIPVSSQVLVFSKTSMQFKYISPRNPRAIYFNDDTYVGWVQGSSLMEVSTNDPKLGAAFYSIKMHPDKARIKRELYTCLACHTSPMTQGVPGHTVRSVTPKADGTIDAQGESFVTDHSSPFEQRWGGWYITGQIGDMKHMGNAILRGSELAAIVESNQNELQHKFHVDRWLTPHSDIVALLVLEHQTQMQNAFTVADFTVRRAIYDHEQSKSSSRESETRKQTTASDEADKEIEYAINQAAKKVVDYMLFVNEAPITSEITSSTTFAVDFSRRGPADKMGRSLRDFNLRNRMFEYPCSYLIYSPAFESLQPRLRAAIYRQLWNVLSEDNPADEYHHLSATTRLAILEIILATKKNLPDYWTAKATHPQTSATTYSRRSDS